MIPQGTQLVYGRNSEITVHRANYMRVKWLIICGWMIIRVNYMSMADHAGLITLFKGEVKKRKNNVFALGNI
jgi:hypothetical protein